eukprot:Skav225626  [mRNA]  locus=scaffold1513:24346:25707:+ [translate_table: standard]
MLTFGGTCFHLVVNTYEEDDELPKKPRRCLKRQCGKRGVKKSFLKKSPQSEAARKKRKALSKKKHAENEKSRKPRAKKNVDNQPSLKKKVTLEGFRYLKKTGWLWEPADCHCSGSWNLCSYEESQARGLGRLFWRCDSCRRYLDVLANSHLRTLRMPLAHVVAGVKRYFKNKSAPTLEDMARDLGHSGVSGTSLQKLRDCLMTSEVRVAEHQQSKRQLSGVLEADGTSFRKTRVAGSCTLRYFQCFGVLQRDCRIVNLYDIGPADAANFGKPPVETLRKITNSGALAQIMARSHGERTVVCTDGAKCYPAWCKSKSLLHHACSHRKNQFVKTVRRRSGVLKVHTGGIDNCWKMIKKAIPSSVNTLNNGKLNPAIWRYVRCWQHRWESSADGCLASRTAHALNQMV